MAADCMTSIRRYLTKLQRRTMMTEEDSAEFLALPLMHKSYRANELIVDQGVTATHCAIVTSGLVSRVKSLPRGSRQIVALHLPGDAVDLQSIMFKRTDHAIYAHAQTDVTWVPHHDLRRLSVERPAIGQALWLDTLVDAAIFREWTANIGRRKAQERTAHLFLELATRMNAIGELRDGCFELPLTQTALADALGLSLVHMNKSLQALRRAGYLEVHHRTIALLDRTALVKMTGFDDGYLHTDPFLIKDEVVDQALVVEA